MKNKIKEDRKKSLLDSAWVVKNFSKEEANSLKQL